MEMKVVHRVLALISDIKRLRSMLGFLMSVVSVFSLNAQTTTLSVGGKSRTMFVYAPTGLAQNRPLVISMHGLNQDINYQKGQAKWEQVADTAKFVVVYPAGESNSWDINGTKDTDFISAIIDNMVTRYGIDRSRVYVSGFSMGGMMSYHVANKIADKVAAIGPVSGYLFSNIAASSRPMPIIHVHGNADDVVRYQPTGNQQGVVAMLQKWRTWNGCPSTGTRTTPYPTNKPASKCIREYWGPCNKSEVELITLDGKGHWHSNDAAGVVTTYELWRFFRKQSLNTGQPTITLQNPAANASFTAPASIMINASASDAGGSVANVKFYNGTTLLSTDNTAPYSFEWTNVSAGSYTIRAVATDNENKTAEVTVSVKVNTPQGPYNGTAHLIPGTIQMEHFDVGGNGSAYMDSSPGSSVTPAVNFRPEEDVDLEVCNDVGGGHNLGFTTAGEWLEYTVDVQSAGTYNLDLRVACNGTGRTVGLSIDEAPLASSISIPNTGDWQTWTTVTVPNLQLKAGKQVLRFTIGATDYVNVNYMAFRSLTDPLGLSDTKAAGIEMYPNPFEESMNIVCPHEYNYRVFDLTGNLVQQGNGAGKLSIGEGLHSGIYLLQLLDAQQSYTVKICKK